MDEREVRLERLNKLREIGINPYPPGKYVFTPIHEIKKQFEQLNGKEAESAGRVTAIREHGKVFFADLKDQCDKIQLYFKKGLINEDLFDKAKLIDLGDFILAKGEVTKTRTGEITIMVREWKLLSKSLRPLPEKWHGLTDPEVRYRQRYLDLISSDETKKVFITRSKIVRRIREFLYGKGFMEVETPMMQPIAGGAAARPFITHHNTLDIDLYMRIAPELYLKRLVVGGFNKVFELNRNFRNEGISVRHNPEFSMLELYEAYGDYTTMMDLTEELLHTLAKEVCGTEEIEYQNKRLSFKRPFYKLKYKELFKKYCGCDISSTEEILSKAESLGISIENKSYMKIADDIFDKKVQPELVDPTFVIEYPVEISPLAKQKEDDPSVTERFELFISGMEVANAFTELNDPVEQRRRFERQIEQKEEGIEKLDEDFLTALDHGMPPTGGLGVGIDRLTMILTNKNSIREVILFPLQRPK